MRAGLFLHALSRDHDVSLLLLPVAGPAPAEWSRFVSERTVERACLDLRGQEDPEFTRAVDSGRVAALRSYPRPALSRFASDEVAQKARRTFPQRSWGVLHVMGLYLAPLAAPFGGIGTAVLDLNDDEVETRRRIASLHARSGRTASMVLEAAEADKYRALEHAWAGRFDHLLVCSERDRATIAGRTGHPAVHAVDNAAPSLERTTAASPRTEEALRVLFVGTLGYLPNVDAVITLCHDVLPRLRARLQRDVVVDVVGSGPPPAVMGLGRLPGVAVHADVPRVAPFYAGAHAAVVPIRAGGGTRVKILEAFAHGVPVVSTTMGTEGLAVEPGRHLLVADDVDGLADACAKVLTQPALAARLRAAALELVANRYDAKLVSETIRTLFRDFAAPGRAGE
jgi:glycosyltransferase involved in cell wall biosynthesis